MKKKLYILLIVYSLAIISGALIGRVLKNNSRNNSESEGSSLYLEVVQQISDEQSVWVISNTPTQSYGHLEYGIKCNLCLLMPHSLEVLMSDAVLYDQENNLYSWGIKIFIYQEKYYIQVGFSTGCIYE